jgi:steroid delta-isomerase-like uncharacterized protein
MMSAQDNARIARIPYDAFNSRRFDEAEALAASDMELLNVPTGEKLRGPEGLRQFMRTWAEAFPDARVEVRRVIADDTGAAVEIVGRGTHVGTFRTPAGDLPPTNRVVELPFCDVVEIRNEKITSLHTYFDMSTMLRQLGVVPEGARAPEAAPSPTYSR